MCKLHSNILYSLIVDCENEEAQRWPMLEEISDNTPVVDWPCAMVTSQLSVCMNNVCIILVKDLLSR